MQKMILQNFTIDGWWRIVMLYDVWPEDLQDVELWLHAVNSPSSSIKEAIDNLSGWNAGYTLTSFAMRTSIVCVGRATNLVQYMNTVDHEIDHVQAHMSEYYDVTLGTEQSAYLQGYIGGRIFSFIINNITNESANR